MPGRHNSSSIEGGIFGENPVVQAPLPKAHTSYSSIEGGIFGEPGARPITPRDSITKSSIKGGLFGSNAEAENKAPIARDARAGVKVVKEHVAGFKKEASEPFTNPPTAARSDPNRSSVHGGIFGTTTASMAAPPVPSARADPNRSSIQGGIFG